MKLPMRFYQMDMGGMGGGGMGGYTQAVGYLGTIGTDIYAMASGALQKPRVAKYHALKFGGPTGEQQKAIQDNIDAMSKITDLGNLYRSYYTDQMDAMFGGKGKYEDFLSQGLATAKTEQGVSQSWLKGQMTPAQEQAIQRQAAQAYQGGGIGRGYALSPEFTSGLVKQGAGMAGSALSLGTGYSNLAGAGVMNPSNFYITGQQLGSFDTQQRVLNLQTKQAQYNMDAQVDPNLSLVSSRFGSLAGVQGGFGGSSSSQPTSMYNASSGQSSSGINYQQLAQALSQYMGGGGGLGGGNSYSATGGGESWFSNAGGYG